MYPPLPLGDAYKGMPHQGYILSVGRLCRIKRVDLMIKSMPFVDPSVKLKIVGLADEPDVMEYLTNLVNSCGVANRVEFLGRVDNDSLIQLYAEALAVYYAPFDEDYGYVTLEAMASSKPVVTATDSGGTLEFVKDFENGRIVSPDPRGLGEAFNQLYLTPQLADSMGARGRSFIESSGIMTDGWNSLIDGLLSPLA
jgi:glycosyltransferase involved in cell wall biosynthesis